MSPVASAAVTVPVCRIHRPASSTAARRSAVTGGMRWRWASQARASSARKVWRSSSERPRHSWAVTGRRPSMAARQSPVSATVRSTCARTVARTSARECRRVMPGGGGTGGVVGSTWWAGTTSWRETVWSVRPGRSAAMATSTMVRPVPTRSRSPSGRVSVHGSRSRPDATRASGAQSVPAFAPVASTTARATMVCPSSRRTTRRSPRRSMPTTPASRRTRRALAGYSAAVRSRPST